MYYHFLIRFIITVYCSFMKLTEVRLDLRQTDTHTDRQTVLV